MVTRRTGVPGRAFRLLLAVLGAVVVALAGAGDQTVRAQGLEDSSPSDGAVLTNPPETITVTFDTEIENSTNPLVAVCNSNPFVLPAAVLSSDSRTLEVTMDPNSPMPLGACIVEYNVVADGETLSDRFTFSIQNSPVTSPGVTAPPTTVAVTETTAAPDDSTDTDTPEVVVATPTSGPTWLGRLLSTLGLAVLFGSVVLIAAAWPEGPEYVVAVRFLRTVWVVAMAGTLLYVIAYAAAARGSSLGGGVSPAAWLELTDAGWPGRAALARLVLTVLTGWVVLRPERVIDPTTQLPAMALPTLAVATIGLSRTGGDLAIVGVIAGIGHALAMAVWIGAVVLLARVVLAGAGDEDLVHAVRGFNRISGPAIVITVLTGLVQLFRLDGGALFTSGHGRIVLVKTLAVAVMLFIGMTARQVAQHRLARAADLSAPAAFQLRRAFGTEAVLGGLVLALSAGLLSFTPAKADEPESAEFAIEKVVNDVESGLNVVVRLDPGRVGQNRLQVEVVAPETGVSGLTVSFVAPIGTGAETIVQPILLTGRGIADTTAAAGLPFDVAGAWTMQIDATTAEGAVSGAGGSFDIRNQDGTLPDSDIDPTPTGAPVTAATTTTSSSTPATTAP